MTKENIPFAQFFIEAGMVILGLIALYAFISLMFTYTSGWRKLRKIHSVERSDLTESWPFQSASFRRSYDLGIFGMYRRCLRFGYNYNGAFLSGMFPFVLFHNPILIPWDDVILTKDGGFSLSSARIPEISIFIPKKVYDGLMNSTRIHDKGTLGIQ